MANEGESFQYKGLSLKQARKMRSDNAIIALQEQVRKLTMELEQVKGFEHQAPRHREFNINPIDLAYSFHEDYEEVLEEEGLFGDDLSDLRIKASEFDGYFKLENYIDWVQAIKRIIKLKQYNDVKAFKLAILKLKRYDCLWYEALKKSRARETKSKIET